MAIKYIRHTIFFIVFIGYGLLSTAQNGEIEKIKSKAEQTKKEIAQTNKLLEETEKNQKVTLERLELLNQQIKLRSQYLQAIQSEIGEIGKNITVSKATIRSLESELEQLHKEYELILFTLYKIHNSHDQLVFVLSAEDFNQAYNRIEYLRYYSDYMISRFDEIKLFQDSLGKHIAHQEDLLMQKKNLVQTKNQQKNQLTKDKSKEAQTLQKLSSQEKELQKRLQAKIAYEKKLNKEIERLIREAAKAAKATPEDNLISKNFAENRGHLPWPTNNGRVTQKFGTHRHPTLPIDVDCNGIDITTTKGTVARSIFDGTVSKIVVIPGRNTAVLIKHGDYYTVYDNLIHVRVKKGQKVSAKQELGTVYTDPETGTTVLQLQIWKDLQKMNPEPWLSK
ncbi:MAG: peptidoglycan DD-metalloendopeptidase family protein [Bacteroidales bacterium]|jgi:septal ring factor EnvC (AmiA/AmiB activator)|nr:peptidoglycan DD-metalloendopeptidase family protein [Bacteroidales bacterium]